MTDHHPDDPRYGGARLRSKYEVVVGVKMIMANGGMTMPFEEDRAMASLHIMWVRIGDQYLTPDDAIIYDVSSTASHEPLSVNLRLGASSYRTVNAYGPEAPEPFRSRGQEAEVAAHVDWRVP